MSDCLIQIYAWGLASNFQTYAPLQVKLELKVEQIACNSLFNVIVTKNRDVYTWNKNQMEMQRNEIHVTLKQIIFHMIPEDTPEDIEIGNQRACFRDWFLYCRVTNTVPEKNIYFIIKIKISMKCILLNCLIII